MINNEIDDKNIGLLKNLFWLRQELDVYCLISVNSDKINKKGAGKSFFSFLQTTCIDMIALNICKIYECEKNYELNSVEGVLQKIIDDHLSALDSSEVDTFLEKYNSRNKDELLVALSLCIKKFKKKYEKELETFKTYRDKRVAQSEHGFNINNLPSYDIMEHLFEFGSDFYQLVCKTFISNASVSIVPCDLNSNRKVKVGLKKVLNELGLTDIKTEME